MINKIKSSLSIVIFGLSILRWCGFNLFFSKLLHQLYGRTVFLETITQLDISRPSSSFKCTMRLASPDDVKALFNNLNRESPEGRYQLLGRKWYHERGFGDCCVGITADTNEICAVCWLVTPEHIQQLRWGDIFTFTEGEIMIENVYVPERYRGTGAHTAFGLLVWEKARELGYKLRKGYIDVTNIPERKYLDKYGSKVCKMILERHILFHDSRKTLEEYDPPIPITVP